VSLRLLDHLHRISGELRSSYLRAQVAAPRIGAWG